MTQRCIAGGIWSKTISPQSRSSAPSPRDTTRQSKASAPTSTLPLRSSPQGKCQQTLAEDGRLNVSERPWLRSVIINRPKVLTGRGQNGTRVGSSTGSIDDGGTVTRRTIGRSLPIRVSTLDNRVSPLVPPQGGISTARKGDDGGGKGESEKANAAL